MNSPTDPPGAQTGRVWSPTVVRGVAVLGWILLACFGIRVASLGGIASHVRPFQVVYLVGFAGYFALVWVVTRRPCRRVPGSWRLWLGGCIALRLLLATTEPGGDVWRYVWEGRIQLAGFNPYVMAPDDSDLAHLRDETWSKINHRDYPAIYPPIAQMAFAAVTAGHDSVYAMKAWHVLCDVLTIVILGACLRRVGRPQHCTVIYALCPLVLSAFAIEGHVDSVMLFLVAAVLWAALANRFHLAGLLLGLAIAAKLVVVVLLPWFAIRHWRAALIALAVAVLCYVPYLDGGAAVFSSLRRFGTGSEFFSLPATLGLTSYKTQYAHIAAASALGMVLFFLARRREELWHYGQGAAAALLLLMPIVHYWYLTWVLLFLPFSLRVRWLIAALAMVTYFEAGLRQEATGVWTMPHWVPSLVWSAFLVAWFVEAVVADRAHTWIFDRAQDKV